MSTADKRIPVTEETWRLIKEEKPDGMTFDLWLRRKALGIQAEP